MLAPAASTSSGWSVLTVALVPTGMNCGVSTTPWDSVSRPRRARVVPSAGGGTSTSKLAAPGMAVRLSARRQVVPQGRHVRFRAARHGDIEAQGREMRAGSLGGDATLRGAVKEA